MIKNRNIVFSSANDSSSDSDKFFQLPQISNSSLPTAVAGNEGGVVYDATNNKVYFSNGSSWSAIDTSGNPAYDDVADPDADSTIAFTGYTNTWTSTLNSAGGVFTISNTVADLTANVSLVDLKLTDDGDANGFFLRAYDNSGADLKFQVGLDGATTISGNATGTAALTLTAGDITMSSGDVDIAADNRRVSFGASGDSDSYILFDGSNLTFFDVTAGSATLAQLISGSPTGDFTISNGQFSWTDSTDEQGGTWTFAGTAATDIVWSSAVTTGKALSVTADALSTGSMVYLDSDGLGSSAKYIECFDGSADDFSVGANGAVVIAGVASTDVLTISAGDLQITAGDIDVDLGFFTVDNTADEGNYIKRNNATGTLPVLEIEETHATGGIALLVDTKNTTVAEYAIDITSSGATELHLSANGAAGDGILVDVTNAHTGQIFKIDAGPWLGTAGEGAALDFRSDAVGTAEAGHVIYIKMQGTGTDAAAIEGKGLYIEDEGALQAGSYLVSLDSLANGALLVKAGISTFKGDVVLGVDATGVDFKAFGDTTAKYLEWDQSADSLFLTSSTVFRIGGTETPDGVTFDFDGADLDIDAVTANDNIKFGTDVDTNVIFNTAGGAALSIDHGANSLVVSATAYLLATGSGTGKGLVIPSHATASPSQQDVAGAGNMFFEVDAKKLWVYDGTGWVGVVLA